MPTKGKKRQSRKGRGATKRASRRKSGRFQTSGPQLITRPGSKPGLVNVVEVDHRGNQLRTVEPNVPYVLAVKMIRDR
jgi:hypothetical protein